jgi:dihydrofolate reductase
MSWKGMTISMIAACATNRAIGKDNGLMWHMPNDLKFFKRMTKGHPVIMGRKTFESFDGTLPHRTNIVITRRKDHAIEQDNCVVVHSLEEALERVEGDDEPFIVGGEQIYRIAMEHADRLYITWIHAEFEGDAFFPEIGEEWKESWREEHPADDSHAYPYSFVRYERRTSSL